VLGNELTNRHGLTLGVSDDALRPRIRPLWIGLTGRRLVDDKRPQKATLSGGTVVSVSGYAACLIDVFDERLDRLVAADVQLLRDLSGVLRTQSLSSRRCTRRVSGRRS
jgi:hypothetical protein